MPLVTSDSLLMKIREALCVDGMVAYPTVADVSRTNDLQGYGTLESKVARHQPCLQLLQLSVHMTDLKPTRSFQPL